MSAVPHSSTECQNCYLKRRLTQEAELLQAPLTRVWIKNRFREFFTDWLNDTPLNGYSRARLRRYARFFVSLDEEFNTADVITENRLVEHIGTNELRRHRVPYAWLVKQGVLPEVTPLVADSNAQTKTQNRLLARVHVQWKAELMQRYLQHLRTVKGAWRRRGWTGENERYTEHTVTMLLRAAFKFLQSLGDDVASVQGVDAYALNLFVNKLPGHTNSLHSFVNYLNRREKLFQHLHIDRSSRTGFPYADLLTPARANELRQRWLKPQDDELRNALLCLLMLLYARTAKQACSLRRGLFDVPPLGQITARFGPVAIELEEPITALLRRHLKDLERTKGAPLEAQDYLFPGLMPGRPFTAAGVQYVLRKQGVSANELYTTAIASFYRAGLRGPKVLVRALGISDLTAIKYWEVFCPRISDEMKHLSPVRGQD